MYNKVILIGEVFSEPINTQLDEGSDYSTFILKTTEFYFDSNNEKKERFQVHHIIAWNALSKLVQQRIKRGMTVTVEGKLISKEWTDTNNRKRFKSDVQAKMFRIN